MKNGKIIIISGPSGSGKTTLHKKLLLSPLLKSKLVKSISATTRPKRVGEKEGRDYLFVSTEDFINKIERGELLEWQKVFENYYGTPRANVEKLLKAGKNVLLCIDVKGAAVVSQQFPQSLRIFIKTPSLSVLKARLMARGSESNASLKLRLETAREELKEAKKYNYVLVNDQLDKADEDLEAILVKELE